MYGSGSGCGIVTDIVVLVFGFFCGIIFVVVLAYQTYYSNIMLDDTRHNKIVSI